jgi:hypothetical protein
MVNDLYALAARMKALSAAVGPAENRLVSQVVGTIVGDLALNTPVDTSQAISNWRVGIGSPPSAKVPPHFPGKHGSTYALSSPETVKRALEALQSRKPGQTVYIANNLPYIRKLNEGSSTQQPKGFVERAIVIGRRQIRNAKLGLK